MGTFNVDGADQVICHDHGRPQGGPLKGTVEWESNGCNTAKWEEFDLSTRSATAERCRGRLGQTRAKIWMIDEGELVHSLPVMTDNQNANFEAQKFGCLTGSKIVMPEAGLALTRAEYVADRMDPTGTCCDALQRELGVTCAALGLS